MKPTHLLGLLTVLLVNLAGCGFIDPSVATTVTLSPTTLSFSRFLETQQLTATVLDQNGATISNAFLTWSSSSSLAYVSSTGLVTAVAEAEGTATIWATSGSAIGEASVTVLATPQIAFVRDSEIYVMAVDGSNQVNLTNNAADDGGPTWSPNGYGIAFNSNRDGNDEIYMMEANGSNVVRLTNNIDRDVSPAWLAGMELIVFESFRDGNREIYLMVMDQVWLPFFDEGPVPSPRVLELINLTNDPSSDGSPAGSPSFFNLAFHSTRDGNSEIYVMDALGFPNVSNVVRLTNNGAIDEDPAPSPDGSQIAFRSSRDGNDEIYVMDADGSNVVRLTNNAVFDGSPAWSPDRCC